MYNNTYTFSSNSLLDFEFGINSKIIKRIKIFFDTIGDGIYRIGYNIYLHDEYYYKYWLLATNNILTQLKIKKIPLINKEKIIIKEGDDRKSEQLKILLKDIQLEIYKTIKKIAPGIFITEYKTIPIIMVLEIDRLEYFTKIGNNIFKHYNQEKNFNSSFWEIVRNDENNSFYDYYYNRNYYDLYIPSKINNLSNFNIFSRHFKNKVFSPTNLLFLLEILNRFYKMQISISEDLKNKHLFNTMKSKLSLIYLERKNYIKLMH